MADSSASAFPVSRNAAGKVQEVQLELQRRRSSPQGGEQPLYEQRGCPLIHSERQPEERVPTSPTDAAQLLGPSRHEGSAPEVTHPHAI
jgi:hypothetical protein